MNEELTENLMELSFDAVRLFQVSWLFKFLLIIGLIGYVFYALILLLRVRILKDTVNTSLDWLITVLAATHFILVFIVSLISLILIVLI